MGAQKSTEKQRHRALEKEREREIQNERGQGGRER